ncbi:MAG TPA: DUF4124 domain-containing protein [Usitatibacter sp.]|nr:DUF4124 domain-containing protein [Usitatibacter sp.]
MRTPHTRWGAFLLALVSISAVAATVYRWVDEKGVTQFSDSPPPGVVAEAVAIPTGVAQPAPEVDWRKVDEAFMERHRAREKERDAGIEERRRRAELAAIEAGGGTPVPGDTFAVPELQRKVLATIVAADQAMAPGCTDHRVVSTETIAREGSQGANERWTLDRCGDPVAYLVEFEPLYGVQSPPEEEFPLPPPEARHAAPGTIWRYETVDPQRLGHVPPRSRLDMTTTQPTSTDIRRDDLRDIASMKRRGGHALVLGADSPFTVRREEAAAR